MTSRRVLLTLAAALVATGIQAGFHSPSYAVTRISASINFYDELSPYGSWQHVSRYGECWVPLDRPVGWRPYTVGYWVDTDYGWMWISEDPWGGIPYHYGRWAYDSYYGWVWLPDNDEVWGPAWVAWRYGDDYVGWAPLPPEAGWRSDYGLTVNVSILDRRINRYGWCFIPVRTFGSTRIRSSVLPPSRNVTLLARTRNVTRYGVYNSLPAERGLRPETIERATGRKFQRYQVVDSRSQRDPRKVAIQGRTIEVYRPRVTGARERLARPTSRGESAPSRAVIQRQESEQRRFDQRMRQERGVLQREQRRELSQQGQARARQDQVRQRQQGEMQAQREREAQERRSLDQRRKIVDQMQRNEGQGRGRGQGQAPDQGRGGGQGQAPDQGRGRGQGKAPEAKAPDQGKNQGKDQGKDQGNGQSQDDQDKANGRGRGRGGN